MNAVGDYRDGREVVARTRLVFVLFFFALFLIWMFWCCSPLFFVASLAVVLCLCLSWLGCSMSKDNEGNDGWLATHGKSKDKCDEDNNLPSMESLEISQKSTVMSILTILGVRMKKIFWTWKNTMNLTV
ncbi:hypothetical protein Dsin_023469 [Dipteronia sinensis]|uniref:Uncharacterized protein n=1 Tax=Dipteronia sinensis TaxID=43782 RepID=A0AAE0A4H9_9ROSI|nr:hypothetical protein Dsin_023469 [Dipteronia sinensis]